MGWGGTLAIPSFHWRIGIAIVPEAFDHGEWGGTNTEGARPDGQLHFPRDATDLSLINVSHYWVTGHLPTRGGGADDRFAKRLPSFLGNKIGGPNDWICFIPLRELRVILPFRREHIAIAQFVVISEAVASMRKVLGRAQKDASRSETTNPLSRHERY
jgi:hypothetical protein